MWRKVKWAEQREEKKINEGERSRNEREGNRWDRRSGRWMETPPRLASSLSAQFSDKKARRKSSVISSGHGRGGWLFLLAEEESVKKILVGWIGRLMLQVVEPQAPLSSYWTWQRPQFTFKESVRKVHQFYAWINHSILTVSCFHFWCLLEMLPL